ncbi:MAG: DUF1924 domain-containing protein [Rhodocyclaceae bacterium]|nr:DUF1924 domain-containing protein [Rhodocyclaceae bacterium]
MKKSVLSPLALAWLAFGVQAATPAELLAGYRAEAAKSSPGFAPSAQRGAEFYARQFKVSAKMPSCASCHTDKPSQPGRHVVTDKAIKPLAPAIEAERFTDFAKAEKGFGRNCKEVVGRECSAAEKADFLAFVMEGR